jgi:hypothetical protein
MKEASAEADETAHCFASRSAAPSEPRAPGASLARVFTRHCSGADPVRVGHPHRLDEARRRVFSPPTTRRNLEAAMVVHELNPALGIVMRITNSRISRRLDAVLREAFGATLRVIDPSVISALARPTRGCWTAAVARRMRPPRLQNHQRFSPAVPMAPGSGGALFGTAAW